MSGIDLKTNLKINFRDVLGAFLFYLGSQAIIWPLIILAGYGSFHHSFKGLRDFIAITPHAELLNIGTLLFGGSAVLLYALKVEPEKGKIAFGPQPCTNRTAIAAALLCLLVAVPLTGVIANSVHDAVFYFFEGEPHVQKAVFQLKEMMKTPWLFWITAFLITFFVPLIEELLFRGFLQEWTVGVFGNFLGIVLASLIFASFHFSTQQGLSNIEMLSALFALSCLMGCLKAYYKNLKPSIFLHMLFNGLNCVILIMNPT